MMNHAITLDALRALDAIERTGSFSNAAEALYKVPSALSYTIQKLESNLSTSVFDRSKQKAVLTPAGRLLLNRGRIILQAVSQLEDEVKQLESGWETRLNIARDTIIPSKIVFELISEFETLKKVTEINVSEVAMTGGWEALQTGRVQLLIGGSGELPKGAYFVQPIGEAEFVFAISPKHPLAQVEEQVSLAQLKQHTSVVVSDSSYWAPARDSGLLDTQKYIKVDNMAAKIEAQVLGLGVGYLPKHLIDKQLLQGELIIKACEYQRRNEALYLAWPKNQNGKALTWFCQRLAAINWSLLLTTNQMML